MKATEARELCHDFLGDCLLSSCGAISARGSRLLSTRPHVTAGLKFRLELLHALRDFLRGTIVRRFGGWW
jgi:hypothetical protein